MNYRHEWKHEVNRADLLILQKRLRFVMRQDAHPQRNRMDPWFQ